MISAEDAKRVEDAMNGLTEHFDEVQIFASRHEGDGTGYVVRGTGNYFARKGLIRDWLEQEQKDIPQRKFDSES